MECLNYGRHIYKADWLEDSIITNMQCTINHSINVPQIMPINELNTDRIHYFNQVFFD